MSDTRVASKRVLHIITGLAHGGAERQLALLLRHLPVECEVAVLTRAGPLAESIRAGGVPIHEVGMCGNRDLAALPRLVRLIRRGRYDVVHTHLYRACVYGRVAAHLAGVTNIVATEHSLGDGHIEGRRTTPGVRSLYRATERFGTATVAVSPTVARRLRAWGVPPDRLVTIPNSIDPSAYAFDAVQRAATRERLGIGTDEFVIGTVGRLVPTKRLDLLIKAFARTENGATLLVVGDGPSRTALEELARDVGRRVVFAGDTADVAGALAAMDLYATPSTQETFGLNVLEALASGLPVLYTTCPALDDLPELHDIPALHDSNTQTFAPQARRLPTQAAAWAAALAEHSRSGPQARLCPPPAVGHYAVQSHAGRLTALYRDGPAAVPPVRPGMTRIRF